MHKLRSKEFVQIDAKKAGRLLRHIDPKHQRPLSKKHVSKLSYMMASGKFREPAEICIAKIGTERRVVNGMHTIHAIIESNKDLLCCILRYSCDDESDYLRLYHSFDTENKPRSWTNLCATAIASESDRFPENITKTMLRTFRTGVVFYAFISGNKLPEVANCKTKMETLAAAISFADELDFYVSRCLEAKHRRLVDREGIAAAMFHCYRSNSEKAVIFWRQVVSGFFVNQERNNPVVRLSVFLEKTTVSVAGVRRGRGGRAGAFVDSAQIYQVCIQCWNAFLAGSQVYRITRSRAS